MKDGRGYEVTLFRKVWYAEIGEVDQYGVGVWAKTTESYPFPTEAEAVSYLMHRENIRQDKLRFRSFYSTKPYELARVRESTEQLTYEEERQLLHAHMVL